MYKIDDEFTTVWDDELEVFDTFGIYITLLWMKKRLEQKKTRFHFLKT